MSPIGIGAGGRESGFPRVSGDEPGIYTSLPLKRLFSPRERG